MPTGNSQPHSERVTGIEPALSAWEAEVLPLNYTRRRNVPGLLQQRVAGRSYSLCGVTVYAARRVALRLVCVAF